MPASLPSDTLLRLLLQSLAYPQYSPGGIETVLLPYSKAYHKPGRIETEKSRSLILFLDIGMLLAYFTERLLSIPPEF